MDDDRTILVFDSVSYTVFDLLQIYNECKCNLLGIRDDYKELKKLFRIKDQKINSRSEITDAISKIQGTLVCSVPNKKEFISAIRLARRRYLYWRDVDACIYWIIESISYSSVSDKRLKDEIPRDKEFYDRIIYCACYIMILNNVNVGKIIDNDERYKYKLDFDYVDSLRFFSQKYKIDINLNIDISNIFSNIYNDICSYDSRSVYERLLCHFHKNYDQKEKKIISNNDYNVGLPVFWHLVLKAMTSNNISSNRKIQEIDFNQLLEELKYAVALLDANNELDIGFLLPNQEIDYLERLMKYSAAYDLHQFDVDGMLYLIKRIVDAYPEDIGLFFHESANNVYNVIKSALDISRNRFEKGEICALSECELSEIQRNVLDKMVTSNSLNSKYIIPTQWNEVDDDSEWIIKQD